MIPFGDTTTLDVDHDPSTRCFSLQAHVNICCVTNPPPRGEWGFHDRSPGVQRAVTAKRVHRKITAAQTHCEHGGWKNHDNCIRRTLLKCPQHRSVRTGNSSRVSERVTNESRYTCRGKITQDPNDMRQSGDGCPACRGETCEQPIRQLSKGYTWQDKC